MISPGASLLRRIARWNGRTSCILCDHYRAEGRGTKFQRHLERDHVPEDFGLSPMESRPRGGVPADD